MTGNYDRLYRAVYILVGPGDVRERLANAFREEIQYLDPSEFGELQRYELETLNDDLTRVEPSGEKDAIDMSVAELSEERAAEMATEILDLFTELAARGK